MVFFPPKNVKLKTTSASSQGKKNPGSVELQDMRVSPKSSFESRGVEFLDHESFKSRCLNVKSDLVLSESELSFLNRHPQLHSKSLRQ